MGVLEFPFNLSPIQLDTNSIHSLLQALLNKYSINVDEVELEVTETALMNNEAKETAMLKSLTDLGIKINLDDFGTGHSSFVRLINLPLSAIKIDQCFIKDVDKNKNKAEIVKTLIFLAKCLDLKVIAEGIETKEEYSFLQQHQCEYGQGFFMSKPVSSDEILKIFKNNNL